MSDYGLGIIGQSTSWATNQKARHVDTLTDRAAATLQNGLLRAWRECVKYMSNNQIQTLSKIQTNLITDFLRIHRQYGDDFLELGELVLAYQAAWEAASRGAAEQSTTMVQKAFEDFMSLVAAKTGQSDN